MVATALGSPEVQGMAYYTYEDVFFGVLAFGSARLRSSYLYYDDE